MVASNIEKYVQEWSALLQKKPWMKPKIWVKADDRAEKIYAEPHLGFIIFWFVWPKDGDFEVQDYEPVIVTLNNKLGICYLTYRPHWEYHNLCEEVEGLVLPPEVAFKGYYHAALPRAKEYDDDFQASLASEGLEVQKYDIEFIKDTHVIPEMFRTGKGHPSAFGRTVYDPMEMEHVYHYICSPSSSGPTH